LADAPGGGPNWPAGPTAELSAMAAIVAELDAEALALFRNALIKAVRSDWIKELVSVLAVALLAPALLPGEAEAPATMSFSSFVIASVMSEVPEELADAEAGEADLTCPLAVVSAVDADELSAEPDSIWLKSA